jgi:hypothetical protein
LPSLPNSPQLKIRFGHSPRQIQEIQPLATDGFRKLLDLSSRAGFGA